MDTRFDFDLKEKIDEYRGQGWKILGHFCSFTPEELFYSYGYLPVRIFPKQAKNLELADKYLPSYTCSFSRTILNAFLNEELTDFDSFFFSSNCDAIRILYHHFNTRNGTAFIPNIIMPSKISSKCSKQLLREELHNLDGQLQKNCNGQAGESLEEVVPIFRENRYLMRELMSFRAENPGALSARSMNKVYRYNMLTDKVTANSNLTAFLDELKSTQAPTSRKPKLFLLGNCCGNNAITELLEDCGCHVVNDLIASGNKYFQDIDSSDNSLEYLADRLNSKISCPIKHSPNLEHRKDQIEKLHRLIADSNADGVVILHQKFCDPHGLEKPLLYPQLRNKGIRLLELEYEQDLNNCEQLKTRVEAFLEVIE